MAPGVPDLPIAQIKQTVGPTGDQLTALDELNAAAVKANDVVKSSCPAAMPLTPAARLDAAQARLEAMMKAVDIVRGPLQMFYDSLSDEQRQRFDAMGNTGNDVRPSAQHRGAVKPAVGDVADLPVQRIEQVVQPNVNSNSKRSTRSSRRHATRRSNCNQRVRCKCRRHRWRG